MNSIGARGVCRRDTLLGFVEAAVFLGVRAQGPSSRAGMRHVAEYAQAVHALHRRTGSAPRMASFLGMVCA